jgi:hypothetical protein
MSFEVNPNVSVDRDEHGVVSSLEHLQQPFASRSGAALPDPVSVAGEYLVAAAPTYGIPEAYLQESQTPLPAQPVLTNEPPALRLAEERARHKSIVVSYQQTVLGLPIWARGFSVTLDEDDPRAVSSVSTVNPNIPAIKSPSSDAKLLNDISDQGLLKVLGLEPTEQQIHINTQRLLLYQYDPETRQEREEETPESGLIVTGGGSTLDLPPVAVSIQTGGYYVVREVLFTWPLHELGNVNWRAFIEVETGSVLYLRAFIAAAYGYVYTKDPITRAGSNAPAITASAAELDGFREWKELPGITPSNPQSLEGQYVRLSDFDPPNIPFPTSITGDFDFSVPTDGFAAVNAYYQIASLFQLVKDLGFDVGLLFRSQPPASEFPLPVDHRGFNNQVNAKALGNKRGNGSGGFTFGLAAAGTTIGMAADFRVVAHEFCHALLFEAVGSPNFGFAHSAGDSLGCIYCDPGTQAPDRFDSFPWSPVIRRRHDRDGTAGWAWGGPQDRGGYNSEQILSTTLFRAYRAIGGDAGLQRQEWASKYILYLIIAGIASLETSPITPTVTPNPYVTAMMFADRGTILGHTGGGIRKVIRWCFEKQGLYQPPNAPRPVTSRGAPPPVDVYIDDGRNGEYDYIADFDRATGIWNRQSADAGTTHQTPLVGVRNFCYVRINNRGTEMAQNVVVRGYHSHEPAVSTWPAAFEAMTTASMGASNIPPGGSALVGPFEWIPQNNLVKERMLMSVSALGDPSNIDPDSQLACASGPIEIDELVPFDNNIALRTVELGSPLRAVL